MIDRAAQSGRAGHPDPPTDSDESTFERRLIRRLARHPLRLLVSLLAFGLLLLVYGISLHVEQRDAGLQRALHGQRLAAMRVLAATTDVPLDSTHAAAVARAVVAGTTATGLVRLDFDQFDPWVDGSAFANAPAEFSAIWSEAAFAAERVERTVQAAQSLRQDVIAFQSGADSMLLAAAELVDVLIESDADLQAVAAAGKQIMLLQRMSASAGEMLSGRHAALASVDRFGRDAVAFGDMNNALLNGGRQLGLPRIENEDARAVVEHLGREFRTTTALIERIVRGAGAFSTHSSSADALNAAARRILHDVDVLDIAHRQQVALRPPLAERIWLLAGLTLLALAGAALGFHRDARTTRHLVARRGASLAAAGEKAAIARDERDRLHDDMQQLEQHVEQLRASSAGATMEPPATTEPGSRRLAAALADLAERLATDHGVLRRQWGEAAELVRQLDDGVRLQKSAAAGQSDLLIRASLTASDVEHVARVIADGNEELAETAQESGEISAAVADAVREAFADLDTVAMVVKQTGAHVRHVLETTGSVREVAESVDELGERAKMLSLNVAIAGSMEHQSGAALGRFADEVQELADRARQVSRRVGSVNEALRAAADVASDAIKRGAWSSANALQRVQALDAPMSRLERMVRRLERLESTLGPQMRDHLRRAEEMRGAIDAIGPLLEQLRESSSAGVDTLSRLRIATQSLAGTLERPSAGVLPFGSLAISESNPSTARTVGTLAEAETEPEGGAHADSQGQDASGGRDAKDAVPLIRGRW